LRACKKNPALSRVGCIDKALLFSYTVNKYNKKGVPVGTPFFHEAAAFARKDFLNGYF
jgi:hypothetical protein